MTENRESFFKRLTPFFAPSVLLDIELAYTLAKFSHRSQTRKELDETGKHLRYFEHVRRVAIILIDEARVIKPEVIIAALLHDGIEDTRDLTPVMIEHCFGPDVVSIVKVLSKVPKEGYLERLKSSNDWRALMIKACDRLDNMRSLSGSTDDFKRKQVKETRDKYYDLFENIEQIPKTYHVGFKEIRDNIMNITAEIADQLKMDEK